MRIEHKQESDRRRGDDDVSKGYTPEQEQDHIQRMSSIGDGDYHDRSDAERIIKLKCGSFKYNLESQEQNGNKSGPVIIVHLDMHSGDNTDEPSIRFVMDKLCNIYDDKKNEH